MPTVAATDLIPRIPVADGAVSSYRIADLQYRLVRGPLSLEPLHVLRCRELMVAGWQIELVILGASHAVRLKRGRDILTELLACLPPTMRDSEPLAERLRLVPPQFGQLFETLPAWSLPGSVELSRFSLATTGDRLIGDFAANCQMAVDFPLPLAPTGASLPPRTRIGWRVTEGDLEVETVHTYPEENGGVRSRTIFRLGEAAS